MKDLQKQEEMWERQHEFAAEKIYAMCSDLGGFFLKVLVDFPSSSVWVLVRVFLNLMATKEYVKLNSILGHLVS